MNADAVIGCDAVAAGAQWLRLTTASGAVRTIPWTAVKLAGTGVKLEVRIKGVTEKVAPFFATHDSFWIVYAEGFTQMMLEKSGQKRDALLSAFAQHLDSRWRGDQLTAAELTSAMLAPVKIRLPKAIVVMLIVMGLMFFFSLAALFFVRNK